MRHRLVLFVDKKEDRLDTFVVNVRRLKKAVKRLKTVKVNENFFSSFPHFVASLQNSNNNINNSANTTLSTTT